MITGIPGKEFLIFFVLLKNKSSDKLSNHVFWALAIFIYSILTFLSYGILKDLYFWREDFASMYLSNMGQLYRWPYQGVTIINYPPFLLFANQPFGYALASLVLYIALSITLTFFVWKLTKSKTAGFLAGLIFSSGHIGSEALLLLSYGPSSVAYMTALLILILIYWHYLQNRSFTKWLMVAVLYAALILLISYRAHNILLLLLITNLCVNPWKTALRKSIHLIPLLAITLMAYLLLPSILGWYGLKNTTYYLRLNNPVFSLSSNLNLLTDIGNFFIPSSVQANIGNIDQKLNLLMGSFVGFAFLSAAVFFMLFTKNKKIVRISIFFALCYLFSLIIYHYSEYDLTHPSWHRYLFYSFPFFAAFMAIALKETFFRTKNLFVNLAGVVLLFTIIFNNVNASTNSDFIKSIHQRSLRTVNLINNLKSYISAFSGKTLFYFDVVSDAPTQANFNGILSSGIFPTETSLAFIYNKPVGDIKIVDYYDDFLKEYQTGNYQDAYVFFYDKNEKLIDLNETLTVSKNLNQKINLNLSESKVVLDSKSVDDNEITFDNGVIKYKSKVKKTNTGFKSVNRPLDIEAIFPLTLKPTKIEVKMTLKLLPDQIADFPYTNGEVDNLPKNGNLSLINNERTRKMLFDYISERENFRKVAYVTSSGYENPGRDQYLVDGDPKTSWIANKKMWNLGHKPWIQVNLPDDHTFSEVRWVSTYATRIPVSYQYQVFDDNIGSWKTIYSVNNHLVKKNEYVIDKLPTVIKSVKIFRMVIFASSGDFPALSEIEILKNQYNVSSSKANFFMQYPLFKISDETTLNEILHAIQDNLKLKIYPISDKYPDISSSVGVTNNLFLDGKTHTYSFILPFGGTSLKSLIFQFPNVPLEAQIESISLKKVN